MDGLFLGIDGGASKTNAVLCDGDGHILNFIGVGGTNCNENSKEQTIKNLEKIKSSLSQNPCKIFAGISGALNNENFLHGVLKSLFNVSQITLASDAVNVLNAGLLGGDGCSVICGTGSVCFVKKSQNLIRIGGWGYLLDGKGSGYDIGKDGINAALREYDGRGQNTLITQLIEERFGERAENLISEIYSKGRKFIASFAPTVISAAEQGDIISLEILKSNMEYLAELISNASKNFEGEFDVATGGGILENSLVCRKMLTDMSPKNANILPSYPPVLGAAFGAVQPENKILFRENFMCDYVKNTGECNG